MTRWNRWLRFVGIAGLWVAGLGLPAHAVLLGQLRDSVQEFTLDNGLRFLVVERHDAPVFAYVTCVDAGSVCAMTGVTGIAHMFEHEAFKGTETIGTTDYAAERKVLERVDVAWDAVRAERLKGFETDSTRLAQLEEAFGKVQEEAQRFVVGNEFFTLLESNGAQNLNAFTGTDRTWYQYELPSNRLELCARMEGDRLTQPVLREFYKERDVVRNERRARESRPIGRLFEAFLGAAFSAHPYGSGGIGHVSDIEAFRRQDAIDFFQKYYVAANMTVVFVGDVTLGEVRRMVQRYFGDVRRGPDPDPVITVEPEHTAERRVLAEEDANPTVVIGWQGPAGRDPDYATAELLMEILGGGRSSRLYERLVKQEKVATMAGAGSGMPGDKYPNQMMVFAYVAADQDPLRAEALVYDEVRRLIAEGPSAEEVQKVRTAYLANRIRQLREPMELAIALGKADQIEGNWKRLFEHLDRIEAVTPADIQRVASERLVPARRTVGVLTKKGAEAKS